ncbi:Crystal protein ET79 [Streptomyces sp. SID4985]|uniref:aegerolysin family protein n=1 Tax=Streptomyces sp. SID4985 TaxID=2690292 RepID=UPI00136FAD49|nr:aegerolysin family protein [Streptomyces sp. SID4985]MYQ48944.1 Crystal protein ET79 [Streptomyces sp. SID4985]
MSLRSARRPARLRAVALSVAALAGAAAGLAPAAQAAPATDAPASASMSASSARSVAVAFGNNTDQQLIRTYSTLSHGCWDNDSLPPDYVAKHTSPRWGSHSCGMLTGTEGYTNFKIAGTDQVVYLHWDNPYSGHNSYGCDAPAGYNCAISEGGGNNATVYMTLSGGPARLTARTANVARAAAVARTASAARSTRVTLTNYSGRSFVRTGASLSHGIWSENTLPPSLINPSDSGSWQSESDGFLTGTEGRATYTMSGGGTVSVGWDNPFSGHNSYSCDVSAGFACDRVGGDGDNARVTFTVRRTA